MGIALVHAMSTPGLGHMHKFGTSYYSICLSLNILLMLMIVGWLVLHHRNFLSAVGAADGGGGLHMAVVTMLVESYALYGVAFLLYLVTWTIQHWTVTIFAKILGPVQVGPLTNFHQRAENLIKCDDTQVIAPYLIILQVANWRALTSGLVASGSRKLSSIRFWSEEAKNSAGTTPSEDPMSSVELSGEVLNKSGAGSGGVIKEVRL